MTETEFIAAADRLFDQIENALDQEDPDVEADRSGNVITLEADDGSQAVVNKHVVTQQVWLASLHGGYHFSINDKGQWLSPEGKEFWQELSEAVSFISQTPVTLHPAD